ncbi:centrosomal protein of 44 kDa-like [Saimiri boliviensis]|uniref:centrosomal protein of 44 kDa-like n=1 Tax=Saimiri boliviensis TaxID=27679 RepID=UPI003D76BE11
MPAAPGSQLNLTYSWKRTIYAEVFSNRKSKVERPASIPLSSGYSTATSDSTPRTSTINYCGLNEISEETTIQKMERMKKMFEETAELLKCSNH